MKHLIWLIFFLFQLALFGISQINLKGMVTNDGCNTSMSHKDCKVFKNVRVSVGASGDTTDFNGRFSIDLSENYLPGSEVIANVTVPGHVIHMPFYGRFILPNTLSDDVLEQRIIMLPKGSLKLTNHAAVVRFLHDLSNKGTADAKSKKEAALKNFELYFKEFADYHGFTPQKVQELIDQWANSGAVKNAVNDFMLQGARNFYLKQFNASSIYYEQAAELRKNTLIQKRIGTGKSIKETALEIDSVCYAYILAGNSSQMGDDFKRAIKLYNLADSVVTLPDSLQKIYGSFKYRKAQIQNQLAIALTSKAIIIGGSEGAALLTQAVAAYHTALEIFKNQDLQLAWAVTQTNLGDALKEQAIRAIGQKGAVLLSEAVAAYSAALVVYIKGDLLYEWALTQTNLGDVLREQGIRTDGANGAALLARAVSAHRAALEIYSRQESPQNWALVQNNLGMALDEQGRRAAGQEGITLLAQAVVAFRAALEIYTQDLPQSRIMTQNSLGSVLIEQASHVDDQKAMGLLAEAVATLRSALEICSKENLPRYWTGPIQANLGNALGEQGERANNEEGVTLLTQAVAAYRAALEVVRKEDLPQHWAMIQNNLAGALRLQATHSPRSTKTILLTQAATACRAAFEIHTKEDLPQDWSMTQVNLGNVLQELGMLTDGEEGIALLIQAVNTYKAALEIYNKKNLPLNWARTQNNLAITLSNLGWRAKGQKQAAWYAQAADVYHAALEIYTKKEFPRSWAIIQKNLGVLCEQTKQWKLAIQYFENVRGFYPEYVEEKINGIRNKMKQR
ncbi:MAG: hypothetical protein WCF67_04505 [Chitinophagaceae bacterium]